MIDYKGFIENTFKIRTKKGEIAQFRLNQPQIEYYSILKNSYNSFEGVRENILKGRQLGFSSLIDAIFTTDFIFSSLGKLPVISGQIISHKDKETKPLFQRVDLFLDSYLEKMRLDRKDILRTDNRVSYIESYTGAEIFVGTAGAKTMGRGGTLQNLHWSEVGYYPNTEILNAEDLVIGAEQQVADGVGKIFRESTGHILGDFFEKEYRAGCLPNSIFKSRFFEWFRMKEYQSPVPRDYQFTQEDVALMETYRLKPEQMYWYARKLDSARDRKKIMREYPFSDNQAFLSGGDCYFDTESLQKHLKNTREPMTENLLNV